MPSRVTSCVIGIDVGGTNTDAVVLQNENVLAWHKTPTTSNIQDGVEEAIAAVIKKADIPRDNINSINIGTTQFVNAVLEQDANKLDKVAVIRLCGPYSRGSPPFVDFPPSLRRLIEGHYGFVSGGLQVDGSPISDLNIEELKEQAAIIKAKSITSVVVIGIYSPSNPAQEEEARRILSKELGPRFDISCSHNIGRIGFLERENASILNASLRRFARHVITGFAYAVQAYGATLYITLNDGTLSRASIAAEHPVRCFSSGPTNSARGAALLAKNETENLNDGSEVLVVDVGGTTTDICALLPSGYPRQSAAFVKIAGIRTNFTIPDVHSIALGGGSLVRTTKNGQTSVGPDSVGPRLEKESISFGGQTLTATDLVMINSRTEIIAAELKSSGQQEIQRALEQAIDQVKTKQGQAKVILVGGGSIIVGKQIVGVGEVIRPKYLEVANAIGAAIGKISGVVDTVVTIGEKTMEEEIEEAKALATERCIAAGGNKDTIEVVEVDVLPINYVTNGATQLVVRVVGDLRHTDAESRIMKPLPEQDWAKVERPDSGYSDSPFDDDNLINGKASTYEISEDVDIATYRPRIEGDIWHLSEVDLKFLLDGAGVLGVGSCGEPYPSYIACMLALKENGGLRIRRQNTIPDDALVLTAGFMGSPTVYLERIPGLDELTDTVKALMSSTGIKSFDATIPNEIGGLNAFESLLAAHRLGRPVLDTDCVARAYPMVWQTVRCLNGVPVTPAAVANGAGQTSVFLSSKDAEEAEELMRNACTDQGSLSGMVTNPISGKEAKTLPSNSYSWAWTIGRSIAIARSLKIDPVSTLLESQNGILLFTGKVVSVTRTVAKGFTRGSVLLDSVPATTTVAPTQEATSSLYVEFENENLCAIQKTEGKEDVVLALCPDLITFLDIANGAPLGISDYKYGLRVSVIALKAPPMWTSEKGLEMGGPKAFGLNMDYKGVSADKEYSAPKSVWELFGDEA